MNLFLCIMWHCSFSHSRSDCEISAGLSITGVSVWLWDTCRPFKYRCQCLIVRYLQVFQVLVSVSDCEISTGLSITGVSQCLIVRYLQAFQVLVSVSDCEISAGLSSTDVSVWLWDICRLFKNWCQCLIQSKESCYYQRQMSVLFFK